MKNILTKSLGPFFIAPIVISSTITTPMINFWNNKQLQSAQNLKDVIKVRNLGDIIVPRAMLDDKGNLPSNRKVSLIKSRIKIANPHVDMEFLELTHLTEKNAFLRADKSIDKYFGTVQISYNLIIRDFVDPHDDEDKIDIKDLITNPKLGTFRLKSEIDKVPPSEWIENELLSFNFKLWKEVIIISDITETNAIAYGYGQKHKGKKTIEFKTISVYEWDEDKISFHFPPKFTLIADNLQNLISQFLRQISDVWMIRASRNLLTFKQLIESYVEKYFNNKFKHYHIKMKIFAFQYRNLNGKNFSVQEREMKNHLVGNSDEWTFRYNISTLSVPPKWSREFYTRLFNANETIRLKNRYAENKRPAHKIATNLIEHELADHVEKNKDKIIKSFIDSEYFKPFKYLHANGRIQIDFVEDYKRWVERERKIVLKLIFDKGPIEHGDQVIFYDNILFKEEPEKKPKEK